MNATIGPADILEATVILEDDESSRTGDFPTQYIIVEDGIRQVEDPAAQQQAPFLLFEDGTIKCIDQLLLLQPDAEKDSTRASSNGKRRKRHACQLPGCDRSYSSQHHLKVHERSHTGDRPYKCPLTGCSKEFNTHYSRTAHIRTHTGERPYVCTYDECGKGFKTSGDLQRHTRTHTGERPFVCPIDGCDKSFSTSNICKIHIRTHTGERPYVCQEEGCDRIFGSSTNCRNHMRIHTGEKPYSCKVTGCEKRFTEYSSLYKHRLVHCPNKHYQCSFCQKSYRQLSSLTTHKRTIHGVVVSEDGTELLLEKMIGSEGVENFKTVTSNLMNLKKVNSITFHENASPLYIFSETES